jgi:hypothetical protein
MNALVPSNPALLQGYPATLPIEVAQRNYTNKQICESYGIDREEWERICALPSFIADVQNAMEMLRKDGMSFRTKARLQAEELLKTSWTMIHDKSGVVGAAVKADLLKYTIRVAGLEPNPRAEGGVIGGNGLSININLG